MKAKISISRVARAGMLGDSRVLQTPLNVATAAYLSEHSLFFQ